MNETYEYQFEAQPEQPEYETPVYARQPVQPQQPKKKSRRGVRAVALALSCALLGGAAGAGAYAIGSANAAPSPSSDESTILAGQRESKALDVHYVDTSREMTPAEVYAANVNSTVGITTSVTTNFWGFQTQAAASGSGFIISADGYILTNYHVVESSDKITVTLYDSTSYDAQLVGYDESNDIAVLKVDATGLTPVVLGDSDQLNVGDSVLAIGNPLGELTFSLTAGTVSALNREITLSNNITMNLIQTDCAINSGNSGGALFNLYGEVVGITNAKYSSSGSSSTASIDNIGFAIPINQVNQIVQSIIEKGYIAKPYIGVYVSDVSDEAQNYGLPTGAALTGIMENSPAQTAGLQKNDIVTQVNGEDISSGSELSEKINAANVGDKLSLTVYRQGQTFTVEVEVGEQIQSAREDEAQQQEEPDGGQQSGDVYGNGGQMPDFWSFFGRP